MIVSVSFSYEQHADLNENLEMRENVFGLVGDQPSEIEERTKDPAMDAYCFTGRPKLFGIRPP